MSPRTLACPLALLLLPTIAATQRPVLWSLGGGPFIAASAGDVDGDGVNDMQFSNGSSVTVRSGDNRAVLFGLTQTASSLAPIGDVNGGGFPDLLIGDAAFTSPITATNGGGVWIYSSENRTPVLPATPGVTLIGLAANDRFGASVTALPGKNGQLPGFAVGAPQTAGGTSSGPGYVTAYSSATGGVLWRVSGGANAVSFGECIATIADVNNDGIRDLAVGDPGDTTGGAGAGAAHVLSSATGAVLLSVFGTPGDAFGTAVADAGLLNVDGVGDLFVGAPGSITNAGRVTAVCGTSGIVIQSWTGLAPAARLGDQLASLGDADGDGAMDLAAHSGGVIQIISGANPGFLATVTQPPGRWGGPCRVGGFGAVGDVNKDGVGDFVMSKLDPSQVYGCTIPSGWSTRAYSGASLTLQVNSYTIAVAAGGTQTFTLCAGPTHANRIYVLAGSATGTGPGLVLPGGLSLPLTIDAYFWFLTQAPNSYVRNNTGSLDGSGKATAILTFPPLPPVLVGTTLWHAYTVLDPVQLTFPVVSNPVCLMLK